MKKCPKCGVEKREKEFYSLKSGKLSCHCKECGREYQRRFKQSNPNKVKDSRRKHYLKNKDNILAKNRLKRRPYDPDKAKKYRKNNPDRIKKLKRKCYLKNKDKVLESNKRWARENRKKVNECNRKYNKRYREKHPEKSRNYTRIRRARKKGAKGCFTHEQVKARFHYYGNRCYYCGCDGKMTLDHRIPLSKGGTNWPANIVPACMSCNSSKRNKTEKEFLTWKQVEREWVQKSLKPSSEVVSPIVAEVVTTSSTGLESPVTQSQSSSVNSKSLLFGFGFGPMSKPPTPQ